MLFPGPENSIAREVGSRIVRQMNRLPAVPVGFFLCATLAASCAPPEGNAPGGSTSSTAGTSSGDSSSSGDGDTSTGITSGGDGDTGHEVGEVPGGITLKGSPDYHAVVRLTHQQWENSVRDIFQLGEQTGVSMSFYPDPPEGRFSNNEKALYVEAELWVDYQRGAETVAEAVATDAAIVAALGGLQDSSAFIEKIGKRAFRRPLTAEEKSAFEQLWKLGATYYASGDDAVDGARLFLEALLQSPHFVYRLETTAAGARLSGPELATKLSLFLKNTTPSDALLASAESGALDTDEGLVSAALDLVSGENAADVFKRFHSELYGLDRYKNIQKSPTEYPEHSPEMNQTLLDADLMFFEHVFLQEGGLREILQSDVAFVDASTAPYYEITSPGATLSQVTLDGSRPGFLTRLGFLAKNATLAEPDPIHRGVDINLRILCKELEPPSGTIPPLPTPEPGQTNRELVEAHTGEAVCAQCHMEIINPLGFAFENFDSMGEVRTTDAGKPINTADSYAFNDGLKSFENSIELIDLLSEHEQSHGCYSARLAEFVLGRDVAGREEEVVTSMQQASFAADASMKELVLTMIQSPLFTTAQSGAAQ